MNNSILYSVPLAVVCSSLFSYQTGPRWGMPHSRGHIKLLFYSFIFYILLLLLILLVRKGEDTYSNHKLLTCEKNLKECSINDSQMRDTSHDAIVNLRMDIEERDQIINNLQTTAP